MLNLCIKMRMAFTTPTRLTAAIFMVLAVAGRNSAGESLVSDLVEFQVA